MASSGSDCIDRALARLRAETNRRQAVRSFCQEFYGDPWRWKCRVRRACTVCKCDLSGAVIEGLLGRTGGATTPHHGCLNSCLEEHLFDRLGGEASEAIVLRLRRGRFDVQRHDVWNVMWDVIATWDMPDLLRARYSPPPE